ncbi:hypothetical protein Tco_1520649, partial [Tanacetum coccineum]
ASFKKPLASEVALTSHMLKVAKLFQESEQSLILSFEKVNIDDGADKSLSRTSHAEEIKATTDATQSLGASESAEDQVNQPQIADAEKGMILKGSKCLMFDLENSRLCWINPSMHES